jgi:DNA polymerase-3 subunit gamma/tau
MVFYRTYRPQKISELDLISVRERLISILQGKSVPHAFLFTGPKGLGKTSGARILAKAINCEKKEKGIEPCNVCDACISITNGSNIDVLEIDAASNRGIDEIRELRDKIKFSPSNLKYKVYIIDEVHMLTNEAFNALLKTLEEPPSHAIFILCTTEKWKVPGTIISRSFHVAFEKPTKEEMLSSFDRIVAGEKLNVEKGVLEKVFTLSEGAFRDGAKILEELSLAASGSQITLELLEKIFKSNSVAKEAETIVVALSEYDAKKAFETIDMLAEQGNDFSFVTEKIVELLRLQLLQKAGIPQGIFETNLTVVELEELIGLLHESYRQLKYAVIPQLPLELVVAKWCVRGKQQIANDKSQEDEGLVVGEAKKAEKKEIKEEKSEKNLIEEKKEENLFVQKSEEIVQEKPNENEKDFGELFDPNSLTVNFFTTLIDRVKKDNHSIAGVLRGCSLIEIGKEKVIIAAKYKFHKDKLMEPKTRKILDTRASEILRNNIVVEIVLKEK